MCYPPFVIQRAALLQETDWLHAYASRLLSDRAAAEDVAQATLLAALERPPEPARMWRPWLASVARNLAMRWLRAQERHGPLRSLPSEPLERLPEGGGPEWVASAAALLSRLSPPNREALTLRYVEGLSPAIIARRLDCPVATVRSRIKRGLAELRARHSTP